MISAMRNYRTRFEAAFHYADPGPTRFWLITSAIVWGLWLLAPGDVALYEAWRILLTVGGEKIVGPTAVTIGLLAFAFDVAKSKRLTVVADILLVAWWLFVLVSLALARPTSPSVAVYAVMVGFGLWLLYRDVDQT